MPTEQGALRTSVDKERDQSDVEIDSNCGGGASPNNGNDYFSGVFNKRIGSTIITSNRFTSSDRTSEPGDRWQQKINPWWASGQPTHQAQT